MSDTVKMSEVFDRMRYDALVDLFIDGRPSFDEAEAAAHAIMNHDELLAALEWALSEIVMEPFEWSTEEQADAHYAALAAITKARGGTT